MCAAMTVMGTTALAEMNLRTALRKPPSILLGYERCLLFTPTPLRSRMTFRLMITHGLAYPVCIIVDTFSVSPIHPRVAQG